MKRILLLLALVASTIIVTAQDKKSERLAQFNLSGKTLAIEGYDPVSYFAGAPKKGSGKFAVEHQGVIYRFANEANKLTFLKSPGAYEPQYGGWCAYAMGSTGTKVEVDPETYKIVDGKLYLFYNRFFNNTLKTWNENEKALLKSANASWSKFYRP